MNLHNVWELLVTVQKSPQILEAISGKDSLALKVVSGSFALLSSNAHHRVDDTENGKESGGEKHRSQVKAVT